MASCDTCGREIKNYGVHLGGITCANRCGVRCSMEFGFWWARCLDRANSSPEVVFVSKCVGLDTSPDVFRVGDEVPWGVTLFEFIRPCVFEHDTNREQCVRDCIGE